jgi:hypothetical protein
VKQEFYLGTPYVGAALLAFFVCATVFVIAFFRAVAARRDQLDPLQNLPFDDGDVR